MKIAHAADLHIDSPLRGLGRLEDAPVDDLRVATRRAFSKLIDACLDEKVALLLLAGDVFDGDWPDYNTGIFFGRQLARLEEIGARALVIHGNHDAASVVTRSTRLPAKVVRVLSHAAPETVVLEDLGVAVHGQSYATKAVRENLAKAYPPPIKGALNFGLLHTNAIGAPDHDPYAPCTVSELAEHGYDYWALGHVHKRAVLRESPLIVYSGNLQGRHAKETGPKGATFLTVEAGRIVRVEERVLDVARWVEIGIDAREAKTEDDVLEAAERAITAARREAEDRPMLARVIVRGESEAHGALTRGRERLRAQIEAIAANAGGAWIESLKLETRAPGEVTTGLGADLWSAIAEEIADVRANDEAVAPYAAALGPIADAIARRGLDRVDDAAFVRRLAGDVEALLDARLRGDVDEAERA